MSTPLFNFYLRHPVEGEIFINEPVGWKTAKFILKRDQKYHGVNFEYTTQLKFYRDNGGYNGGAEFILFIENKYGIDTQLNLRVEISSHGSEFETFYTGRLNLEDIQETELFVECNVEQEDFYTTFNQRADMQVAFDDNISVDGVAVQEYDPYSINLHSKVLVKQIKAEIDEDITTPEMLTHEFVVQGGFPLPGEEGYGTEENERTSFVQFAFTNTSIQELTKYYSVGGGGTPVEPSPIYAALESGAHTFDFSIKSIISISGSNNSFYTARLACSQGGGLIENASFEFVFKIYDKDGLQKYTNTFYSIGDQINDCETSQFSIDINADFYLADYPLVVDDYVVLYASSTMYGKYQRLNIVNSTIGFNIGHTLKSGSYLKITGKTFGVDSTGVALRLHDVFQNLTNKLTNRDNTFHSDYFGYPEAPFHSYPSKGCGADFSILNGFNIRNFPWSERPLKPTFEDLYGSIDSIFGIGLSLETIDGIQKIRIENLGYYYQKDAEPILILDNVNKIQRTIDKTKYFNRIEIGYEKWQPEDINGLDEFATVHHYSLPLKTTGKPKIYMSKIIASGSIIEVVRRLNYSETVTTDSRYDEDIFIIALNKSNQAIAEKNENFDTVNNLLAPDTAYNIRLSPARNLLRHGPEINGSLLKKTGEGYKFTSGQGNYKMETEMIPADTCPGSYNAELLKEDQDIKWVYADKPEVAPLWSPEILNFEYPLSFNNYKLLKDNRYRGILVSGDIIAIPQLVFILEVEYEPVRSLAKFRTIKANTLPYNYVSEDMDNLLLQDGSDLLLEDEGLILI